MTTYTVTMANGYAWQFAADLVHASATLYTLGDDGERSSTQYQTADARHDEWCAAKLLCPLVDAGEASDIEDVEAER